MLDEAEEMGSRGSNSQVMDLRVETLSLEWKTDLKSYLGMWEKLRNLYLRPEWTGSIPLAPRHANIVPKLGVLRTGCLECF